MYAFSRPDHWTFNLSDIVNRSKDGIEAVRSGLKELEEHGYLRRSQLREEDGHFGVIEWVFFELPQDVERPYLKPKGKTTKRYEKQAHKAFEPQRENTYTVNTETDNPTLVSTEYYKSTENRKEYDSDASRGGGVDCGNVHNSKSTETSDSSPIQDPLVSTHPSQVSSPQTGPKRGAPYRKTIQMPKDPTPSPTRQPTPISTPVPSIQNPNTVKNLRGELIPIDESAIFQAMGKFDFPTEVIQEAIERLKNTKYPVSNTISFVETTCRGILSDQRRKKPKKDDLSLIKQGLTENAPPKGKEPWISFSDFQKKEKDNDKPKLP